MIALFSRQAERFADAVDGGPSGDPALDPLLTAVAELRAVRVPPPRDAFREDLRARLLAEAGRTLSPAVTRASARGAGRPRRRATIAVAATLTLLGGSAGVAVASQSAEPGDLLYPVKRAIERIEAVFSGGQSQQGEALLGQADTRLLELVALTGTPYGDEASSTLADFTDEAERGSNLLLAAYPASGDPSTVTTVREFARSAMAQLAALQESTGGALTEELASAALAVARIDARAAALCPDCGGLPVVQVPASLLSPPGDTGGLSTSPPKDKPATSTRSPAKRTKDASAAGSEQSPGSDPGGSATSGPLDPVTSAVDDLLSGAVGGATDLLGSAVPLLGP